MTLQQLYYAITISETGSLNKAAEILYVSQPSLTGAVRELEKELGITIFYRSGRGVSLTNDGLEFISYARQVYSQYESMMDNYGKAGKHKKKFGISTQHYSFAVKGFVDMVKQFDTEEYEFAIELIFLKEPLVNTEVFRNTLSKSIEMTGNEIADEFIAATNKVLMIIAKQQMYRNDEVFVIGSKVDHIGLPFAKLPGYMNKLIEFANQKDDIPTTVKAAIIHFYISFIHPYFDGNGRMARLVHLWFLIQQGYPSALFVPFSSNIEKSRSGYYKAFTVIEENAKVSGLIDVTPFVSYFSENVYAKLAAEEKSDFAIPEPERFTEKEHELWKFVTAYYGTDEFSTKQLEKDSGLAAYATIRAFVMKFTDAGLLEKIKYSTRCKYKVCI